MELHPDEFSFLLEESKDKLSAVLPKEENGEIFENLQLKIIRALDLKTNAERKARAQEGEVVDVRFTENLQLGAAVHISFFLKRLKRMNTFSFSSFSLILTALC